jgi:uncharacterized protein YndB with AHSA1/START domain
MTASVTATATVTASIEVSVDPNTAFKVFTSEIDAWWQRGPMNWNDPDRAIGVRFEPGMGGRWLEVHDADTGEGFEMGRISAWEPGERLAFTYLDAGHEIDGTEVEVRFEPVAGGTRVTVEHSGWTNVAPDVANRKMATKRWGWGNILNWYGNHLFVSRILPHQGA